MADTRRGQTRSPKSFGVAGLLGGQCRVYYQNVFSPEGLGRVSDLISAKLADAGADELRLRSLLLFGFFDAYRASLPGAARQPLADPVVIEVGIDESSLAFGFGFKLPAGAGFEAEGLESRVRDGKGEFERLLGRMTEFSERVCVKFSPGAARIEIDAVIALGAASARVPAEIEVLVFDSEPEQTPETAGYTELGDLEYSELVKSGAGPKVSASPAGVVLAGSVEVIGDEVRVGDLRRAADEETKVGGRAEAEAIARVKGAAEAIQAGAVQVKGAADAATGETRVSGGSGTDGASVVRGGAAGSEASSKVKGAAEGPDAASKVRGRGDGPEVITKFSGKADQFNDEIAVVKGGVESALGPGSALAGDASAAEKTAELYQRRISQLLERIQQLEREKSAGGGAHHASGGGKSRAEDLLAGQWAAPLPSSKKGDASAHGPEDDEDSPEAPSSRKKKKSAAKAGEAEGDEPELSLEDVDPALAADPSAASASPAPAASEEIADPAAARSEAAGGTAAESLVPAEPQGAVQRIVEGFLSKIWPFNRGKQEESGPAEEAAPDAEAAASPSSDAAAASPELEELDLGDVPDPATALKSLMVEIETGGLEKAIGGLKKEAADLRNKTKSAAVKKLAEEMLREITEEKSKLYAMARKLSWSVKRREMEVRNKEIALQEELKRRDELIKKRDTLIAHQKSQMAQVNMNLERVKSTAQTAVEDQQYKKKYAHLQKLYESAKGESIKSMREVEKMKKQLATMKFSAAAQQSGSANAELDELKGKHDRAQRQLDEFKRMNKQLIDRIGHLERQKATAAPAPKGTEDMRERLDQAMKLTQAARAEVDAAKAKIADLERERAEMKDLLRKAMEKMKKVVASRKPPSAA